MSKFWYTDEHPTNVTNSSSSSPASFLILWAHINDKEAKRQLSYYLHGIMMQLIVSTFLISNKLGVYVGKTENHRGTTRLFTSTFSRLEKTTSKHRDRSELIRGLTNILNEVCEKRYLSQIDSVCEEHSASTVWKIIRSYGLSKNINPHMIVRTYQSKKILIFQFWVK